MKKTLLYLVVGAVAVVLFASCGLIPIDFNGTWTVTGGTYEIKTDYDDPNTSDIDYEKSWEEGQIVIQNEGFTYTDVTRNLDDDDYVKEDEIFNGSGYVSVNSKDKIISFTFTSLTMENDYLEQEDIFEDFEIDYKNNEYSYSYNLNGNTLTLTRAYEEETESYTTELTDTIVVQRAQ